MKRLRVFDYYEPTSLGQAVQVLSEAGADVRLLAGGTDLVVDMKTGRMRPSTVVNLKRIPDLSGVDAVEGGLRIGALTTATLVEQSPLVQDRCPGLAQAASVLASPPVRALATIGGNVGRASPASDLGPALIVHGAVATIQGRDGVRSEPVEDLYAGPGATTLSPTDIITSFFVPDPPPAFSSAHLKLGKRGGGTDIALAGASVGVEVGKRGEILECRIVLVSLGPIPLRAVEGEAILHLQAPSETILAAAASAAADEARPIDDMRASAAYRRTLARVLTLRALREAVRSAGVEVAA